MPHCSGSVGRQKCSLDQSCRRSGRPCDTPPVASYRPSFSSSNCCTRVAHHIRRPEVNASYGGIARDPPFRDVSKRPASGETRKQTRPNVVVIREGEVRPQRGPKSQAGEASPGQNPSCVDAPRFEVTRHTIAPGCACRLAPELRSLSAKCLQPHHSCDGRTANIRRSQPSPCPPSPTGPHKGPPWRPRCRKSTLTPVPPGVRAGFIAPYVAGYKLSLSGGFLFRAFRSAGVQNVTFAGVFVPGLWNTTCHQSASRVCPVGTPSPPVPRRSRPGCNLLFQLQIHVHVYDIAERGQIPVP